MPMPQLGRVGVWLGGPLAMNTADDAAAAAREVERLGYGSLWVAESPVGRDPIVNATLLLSATEWLVVGTGIANVWGRDAHAMYAGGLTIGEAFPGRFVLGLGISHAPAVELRGTTYQKPLAMMRSYLDAMDESAYAAPKPADELPVVLAALRPKMLELARDRTAGAHPYFAPPEHTALAREALGQGPALIPEQAVVLETDPTRAREVARGHTEMYLRLPNYVNNLLTLGFTEEDVAGAGSDRLVDAIVAWGDEAAIRARVDAHHAAGADHVVIQPLEPNHGLGLDQLRALAPALL